MEVTKAAPVWTHTFTCWNCKTELQGGADDLVYKKRYVGESSSERHDYCFVCPVCKQSTFVPDEQCPYAAKKLARSKGLKSIFDDPDVEE